MVNLCKQTIKQSSVAQKHLNSKLFVSCLNAFTLAETLIALIIIGVVAAITIPNVINTIDDMQYKTGYKSALADACIVWKSMVSNYEITERASIYDDTAAQNNFTVFKNYFKVAKTCGFSGNSNSECWDFSGGQIAPAGAAAYVPLTASDMSYAAFIDTQGRQWIKNSASSTFGEIIFVDINGFKAPNKFGKDRFPFFPSLQTCGGGLSNVDNNCRGPGLPVAIMTFYSDTSDTHYCNVDNCYYKSWLLD